jgi:hypothetical protein
MKNKFLVLSAVFVLALLTSCSGRVEETETAEIPETTESADSSGSTNPGGLNDLINGAMNQVETEINKQVSDPNSELLQGIDTLKDIMGNNIVPVLNEVSDKIKSEAVK